METEPAALIIYASYQDPKAAEWLSKRTGIPAVELPSTVGADKETDDLFALYEVTIRRLLGDTK
jgi:zinc/manganese transport system substrate-binding protein